MQEGFTGSVSHELVIREEASVASGDSERENQWPPFGWRQGGTGPFQRRRHNSQHYWSEHF